jgi:hypothetical protein
MSKTILYLVILLILGFGVWFFLFSDKSGRLFRSSDSAFTIRDTGSIGKLFVSENGSHTGVLVERKGDSWIVNGKYPVLRSRVNNLLNTFREQQALYPAPPEAREGIIRNLAGTGIKVEVYDRKGRLMRAFYVGGELPSFAGTAMLMVGSERPYVVNIPGFEGYLTPRYTPALRYWRDRLVFGIAPDQITRIAVHNTQEPLNSFVITQHDGQLDVALDSSLQMPSPLNRQRARSYLSLFQQVYSEGFLENIPDLDSTVAAMPQLGTVEVQGKNGYRQAATLYFFPLNERATAEAPEHPGFEDLFSTDRFFAVMNGGADTVTVPFGPFEKIFRRGYEFFMQDKQPESVNINAVPQPQH